MRRTVVTSAGLPRLAAIGALLLAVVAPTSVAGSSGDGIQVYPPGSDPLGTSYEQWGVRLWQWALGGSEEENPLVNSTDCSVAQPDDVWFLIGAGEEGAESSCQVPAGRPLLISPSAAECSELEGDGSTEAELRQCAEELADGFTVRSIEVNGENIDTDGFRVTTPLFTITAPANNIFQEDPFSTPSVGSMWLVMLHPLPPGEHTIVLRSELPAESFKADVTYHLTVLPDSSTLDAPTGTDGSNLLLFALVGAAAAVAGWVLRPANRRPVAPRG